MTMTSAKTRRHQELRRMLEAARRDKTPQRFFEDFSEHLLDPSTKLEDYSIRMLFENLVEDGYELVQYNFRESLSGGSRFIEAANVVDTAAFANVMGQYLYSSTLRGYQQPELVGDQLVTVMPTTLSGERIPGAGRIGDAVEIVNEGNPYPIATFGEEYIDTPETIKRGLIVPVTKEAIFFDKTGMVLQQAANVGQEVAVNREKRILDVVCGIATIYRRNGGAAEATYQSDNTQSTNALADYTNINAIEQKFNAMTDPTTGEPVTIIANTLLVPKALSVTAGAIQRALMVRRVTSTATIETETSGNLLERSLNVVTGQYVRQRTSSDTTWFYGDAKEAFGYLENWPLTVINAPENSELDFTSDIVFRAKVTERGAAYVRDRRKMGRCTA